MKQEKVSVKAISRYLRDELSAHYPGRELNAIIKILLSYLSGKDHAFILSHPDHEILSVNWLKVKKICDDLKNMVPVQYITGETVFYGMVLRVTGDTLIPRQETEELVDLVIRENRLREPSILDIGTGTGCIAISLARKIRKARVTATDISREILALAQSNAERNSASVSLVLDDVLDPDISKYGSYDLVVCNPPYVTESEKAYMAANVIDHEPHHALFVPDDDALRYYRAVLDLCRQVLKTGGWLYFEINETKGRELKEMMTGYGYRDVLVIRDINTKERICKGRKS